MLIVGLHPSVQVCRYDIHAYAADTISVRNGFYRKSLDSCDMIEFDIENSGKEVIFRFKYTGEIASGLIPTLIRPSLLIERLWHSKYTGIDPLNLMSKTTSESRKFDRMKHKKRITLILG